MRPQNEPDLVEILRRAAAVAYQILEEAPLDQPRDFNTQARGALAKLEEEGIKLSEVFPQAHEAILEGVASEYQKILGDHPWQWATNKFTKALKRVAPAPFRTQEEKLKRAAAIAYQILEDTPLDQSRNFNIHARRAIAKLEEDGTRLSEVDSKTHEAILEGMASEYRKILSDHPWQWATNKFTKALKKAAPPPLSSATSLNKHQQKLVESRRKSNGEKKDSHSFGI
jgi:hypothetical protein